MAETTAQVLEEKLDETLEQMAAAREAIKHLYTVKLEGIDLKAHANLAWGPEGYEPEDEEAPFFTEAFLYNLLGKEEARTVLSLVRQVGRALGMDDRDLR